MRRTPWLAMWLCLGSSGLLAASAAAPVSMPPAAPAGGQNTSAAGSAVYGWRGDGSGRYPAVNPCTVWGGSGKQNVLWSADVGKSYAGPIVAGDVVLVTSEPDTLVCVSRKDGKVLWTRENGAESLPSELKASLRPPEGTPSGGFAVPTPVTDGRQVFVLFGTGVTACYDLEGKRKWVRVLDAPEPPGEAGHVTSPVLADGRLILMFGGMVALDPATGATLWVAKDAAESCGTPAVAKIGDATVLVTAAGDCVNAKDGKILATGMGASAVYPSPFVQDGVVYFGGRTATAVKLPAKLGDKFDTKPLWTVDLESDVFSSGVWHDGVVYTIDSGATLYAIDAKDGTLVYKKTLDLSTGGSGGIYGSIALAGGNLILGNSSGNLMVLATGRDFKLLHTNNLDGGEGCSPAFAGKQMFLRVNDTLVCIAGK